MTLEEISKEFDTFAVLAGKQNAFFASDIEKLKMIVMHKLHQGAAYEEAFDRICSDAEKCLMEIRLMEQNAKQIKENLKR